MKDLTPEVDKVLGMAEPRTARTHNALLTGAFESFRNGDLHLRTSTNFARLEKELGKIVQDPIILQEIMAEIKKELGY